MSQTALQKAAMTPSELQRLIEASEYADLPIHDLAEKLGYSTQHWWRLRTGQSPILKRTAQFLIVALPSRTS